MSSESLCESSMGSEIEDKLGTELAISVGRLLLNHDCYVEYFSSYVTIMYNGSIDPGTIKSGYIPKISTVIGMIEKELSKYKIIESASITDLSSLRKAEHIEDEVSFNDLGDYEYSTKLIFATLSIRDNQYTPPLVTKIKLFIHYYFPSVAVDYVDK